MGDDLSILSAGSSSRQIRLISHIFVHVGYNIQSMRNDIAVIRLSQPFRPTNTFHPVPMANRTPPTQTLCHVAGWGATVENGTANAYLLRMSVEVLSHATCNQRQSYNGLVREGMICAGTMRGGRDSCQGDSGGGMICGDSVAGVVSFGYGCARPNFPGIYADVSAQQQFVRQSMAWRGSHSAVPVPSTVKPASSDAGSPMWRSRDGGVQLCVLLGVVVLGVFGVGQPRAAQLD